MNNIKLRLLAVIITAVSFTNISFAQFKELNHELSSFNAIDVKDDFSVSIRRSDDDSYSVTMSVDDILVDYIQSYVHDGVYCLSIDKKTLPSDIKKMFKGRKSDTPTLTVTVFMPENLTDIALSDNAVLSVEDDLVCKTFNINLKDKSRISKLVVDAENFAFKAGNKSEADIVVYADNINISTDGTSVLRMNQDCENLIINTSSSADLTINGQCLDIDITASGSSKTTIKGKADSMIMNASNAAFVDAINLTLANCDVKLSNSARVYESASGKLIMNLSGNSTLVYDNNPVLDIVGIKSSTVTRYSDSKK